MELDNTFVPKIFGKIKKLGKWISCLRKHKRLFFATHRKKKHCLCTETLPLYKISNGNEKWIYYENQKQRKFLYNFLNK